MSSGKSMYKDIVEKNSDAIIVLSDRLIVYANRRAAELYGVKNTEEMLGTSIVEYIASSELVQLERLEQNRETDLNLDRIFQFNGYHKDGSPAVYEVSINYVPYEDDTGSLLTIRDATERLEVENRIRALHRSTALLGMATDWDQVSDAVLISLNEILHLSYASLGLVIGDELVFTHHLGNSTVDAMPLDGNGITIRALRTIMTQYVPDTRKDPSYVSSREKKDNESLSELDIPVIVNDEAVAIINIEDHIPNSFSEDEV